MAQRERRHNAGNRLATMVAEERAKIASGEAALSDDDDDFARRPGAGGGDDDDDLVESDFEETDSEAERAADEETKGAEAAVERAERRQQRRRKTARKRHVVPHFAGATPRQPAAAAEAPQKHTRKRPVLAVRVSSRTLAVRKAQETEERTQERELKAKRRRRRGGVEADSQPALTQEQLLEEAKATEIENLEKLRDFQAQAAEDKQRLVATRRAPLMVRPVAHWRSRAVAGAQGPRPATDYALEHLDDAHFPLNPWAQHQRAARPGVCPVTGLPARYVHPRTLVPYANARAYRILEDLIQGRHALVSDIDVWSSTAAAAADGPMHTSSPRMPGPDPVFTSC